MKLDLAHLEVLEAVASHGSFAKASETLKKVRSAVSYDIKCLEEQLGIALLDRSGYRARLTEAGKIILEEGRQILSQARSLEHLATQLSREWEPSLRFVIEGAIPMAPVIRVIKELNTRKIPTIIELQTEILGGVRERFEREEADLMLVKQFEVEQNEYRVDPLPAIHCVLVASSKHAIFSENPKSIQLYELRSHLELNIQASGEGSSHGRDKRVGVPRVLNLSGFYTKKEALLMGVGFGWMPRTLIANELASGELRIIPFDEGGTFEFTPVLMHRKDRPLGRTGVLLRELLLHEFVHLE